jgi:hypothetical protein
VHGINLKILSHFIHLNKGSKEEKELYSKIVKLPFEKSILKLNLSIDDILKSKLYNAELRNYIENQFNNKKKWSRAYMLEHFTCGLFTTQRVESIHGIMSKVLSSNASLQEVLEFYQNREFQNNSIIEEKETKILKITSKSFDKLKLFQYFISITTDYILNKIKYEYELSLNYKILDQINPLEW